MAKQGFFKFECTFGCFIFYRVGDRYYIRQKSRLSRRRVKTSKAFANSRASAERLAIGSCVGASVYRQLPEAWKMYDLYHKLTGLAIRLQKEGKTVTEIRPLLEQQLYDWGYRKEIDYPIIKPSPKLILIRSAKECKVAEAPQQIKPKTHPSTKQEKIEKQERQKSNQSTKRRIRKVSRKYSIPRTRKFSILQISACNGSFQYAGPPGCLHLVMTSRSLHFTFHV